MQITPLFTFLLLTPALLASASSYEPWLLSGLRTLLGKHIKDDYPELILEYYAREHRYDELRCLLDRHPEYNVDTPRPYQNTTLLELASMHNEITTAHFLLKRGANPEKVFKKTLSWILNTGIRAETNKKDLENEIELMRLLKEYGADRENSCINDESYSAYGSRFNVLCAQAQHETLITLIDLFITHGANPNQGALEVIFDRNDLKAKPDLKKSLLSCLIKKGANIDDSSLKTILHWAVERGEPSNVICLLELGANPNVQTKEGVTPLRLGFFYMNGCMNYNDTKEASGYLECCRVLLEHSADPNLNPNDSFSSLHHAVIHQNIDAIQLLLAYGAHPSSRTTEGDTPLHFAAKLDNHETGVVITKMLLSKQKKQRKIYISE